MVKAALKLILLSAVLAACPIANAQPGASTDANSYMPPGPGPGVGAGFPGGGRHRGVGNGQYHHSPMPTRKQVMSLSTLSPSQKQDIAGIYKQAHETMRPLMMQLQQMGGPGPNASTGGAPGSTYNSAAGNPQKADLMRQLHEQRRSTWEMVKSQLTPEQISQLQQQAAIQTSPTQ